MNEKQKVVIAILEIEYEGAEYIGVFHTMDGAKAACEKRASERPRGEPIQWEVPNTSGNQTAKFNSYSNLYVFWDEVEP